MQHYDAVIVGAGPAGSTSAYYMARSGLKVCLLDRAVFPREKVCGGGLCSHIRKFDYIDESYFGTYSSTATIYSPSLKYGVDYCPDKDIIYQTDRRAFDYHLCLKAKEQGAHFFEYQKVEHIAKDDKNVHVYTGDNKYTARVLIGAAGVFCPAALYLRKNYRLPASWKRSQLAFCLVADIPLGRSEVLKRYKGTKNSVLFFLKNVHGGYAWVFPKEESVNIGLGSYVEIMKSYGSHKAFNEFVDILCQMEYLPQKLPCFDIKGGILPFCGPLSRVYADSMLLAGDSAGFVSPLSGEGIFYAMDSGRIAGEVVKECFEKGRFDARQLSRYQDICNDEWGRDLKILNRYHRLLINNAERSVKYARYDGDFLNLLGGIMNMEHKPSEVRLKILKGMVKNFFKFELNLGGRPDAKGIPG